MNIISAEQKKEELVVDVEENIFISKFLTGLDRKTDYSGL